MFGQQRKPKQVVTDVVDAVSPYADQLAHDEKLRARLVSAVAAAVAARERVRQQVGLAGLATRLGSDPVLRAQLAEAAAALRGARNRIDRRRRRKSRDVVVFLAGAGLVAAAVPSVRKAVLGKLGARTSSYGRIEQQIEVDVPVSTAYNQWTQFETFPEFMEGVDEVKQLDDSLLHWAVTVAGRKAEWDARIVEQDPDRRIAWESVDGKHNRGAVTFEPLGKSRTRINVSLSYLVDDAAEQAGQAVGLDDRRVRADLKRFRDLIESRGEETGAWRGTIKSGQPTTES
jgi:uncharacterized membrane protein